MLNADIRNVSQQCSSPCCVRSVYCVIFNFLIFAHFYFHFDHSYQTSNSEMNFKIGRGVLLLIAILLFGYIIIFISVISQSSASSDSKSQQLEKEIAKLRKLLGDKESVTSSLERELSELTAVAASNDVKNKKAESLEKLEKSPTVESKAIRPGVIVLGMHRSGTSVLGGLMTKMGLQTGGPLIMPAKDNEKGFFERIDVVLQNDELMKKQSVWYSVNTYKYDSTIGTKDILNSYDEEFFSDGRRGLSFLNNPESFPWMLKDPRLCITFRSWLPVLSFIPAILFTYRHPLDVAMSMHKRETEHFRVQKALKLWYVYNIRAIEQSRDLCRVTTSHRKMMASPQDELDRIYDELWDCGVNVPKRAAIEDINDFVYVKLQHGRSTLQDKSCESDITTLKPDPKVWEPEDDSQLELYQECMRVYCALEDGSAYDQDFEFDHEIKDN